MYGHINQAYDTRPIMPSVNNLQDFYQLPPPPPPPQMMYSEDGNPQTQLPMVSSYDQFFHLPSLDSSMQLTTGYHHSMMNQMEQMYLNVPIGTVPQYQPQQLYHMNAQQQSVPFGDEHSIPSQNYYYVQPQLPMPTINPMYCAIDSSSATMTMMLDQQQNYDHTKIPPISSSVPCPVLLYPTSFNVPFSSIVPQHLSQSRPPSQATGKSFSSQRREPLLRNPRSRTDTINTNFHYVQRLYHRKEHETISRNISNHQEPFSGLISPGQFRQHGQQRTKINNRNHKKFYAPPQPIQEELPLEHLNKISESSPVLFTDSFQINANSISPSSSRLPLWMKENFEDSFRNNGQESLLNKSLEHDEQVKQAFATALKDNRMINHLQSDDQQERKISNKTEGYELLPVESNLSQSILKVKQQFNDIMLDETNEEIQSCQEQTTFAYEVLSKEEKQKQQVTELPAIQSNNGSVANGDSDSATTDGNNSTTENDEKVSSSTMSTRKPSLLQNESHKNSLSSSSSSHFDLKSNPFALAFRTRFIQSSHPKFNQNVRRYEQQDHYQMSGHSSNTNRRGNNSRFNSNSNVQHYRPSWRHSNYYGPDSSEYSRRGSSNNYPRRNY